MANRLTEILGDPSVARELNRITAFLGGGTRRPSPYGRSRLPAPTAAPMPAGEALSQGVRRIPGQLADAATGAYETAKGIVQDPGKVVSAIGDIGETGYTLQKGLADRLMGRDTAEAQVAGQVGQDIYDYAQTPQPGFTPRQFAEDPLGTVMDLPIPSPKWAMAVVPALKAGKYVEEIKKGVKKVKDLGYDPAEMARRYPELGQDYTTFETDTRKDNFGKLYRTRYESAEEKAVGKVRKQAQKEIKEGNWTRYYDPAKRDYVDPANYPMEGNTRWGATPQDPKTYNQYYDLYNTKEGRERLLAAYDEGAQFPDAKDWYAMGQLEADYVKDFGPVEGRKRFRQDFAEGMAATTGGADPTANFLTTQQLNFRRRTGQEPLEWSIDAQSPVGGRYLQGNIDQYNRVINEAEGLDLSNPKRFDFSGNFMGHLDRATMDEQMTSGLVPGMNIPKGPSYGVAEDVVHKLAAERGVEPAKFQDVAWAGLKRMKEMVKGISAEKAFKGKPMIDIVNEAIWRTHRVTGLPLEEVARRMRAATIPTYGAAGALVGGAALSGAAGQEQGGGGGGV